MRQLARAMRKSGTIAEFDYRLPINSEYGNLPFPKSGPVRFGSTRAGVRPNYGMSNDQIPTFGKIASGVKSGELPFASNLTAAAGMGVAKGVNRVGAGAVRAARAGAGYMAKTRHGAPGSTLQDNTPPPLEVPDWGVPDEPTAASFPEAWDAPSGMMGAKKSTISRPKKNKTSSEGDQLSLGF